MHDTVIINPPEDKLIANCDHWKVFESTESNHLYFLFIDTAFVILGESHSLVASVELTKGIANINYMITEGIETLNAHLADDSLLIFTNSDLHPGTQEALKFQDEVITIISPYKLQKTGSPPSKIKPHITLKVIERMQLE